MGLRLYYIFIGINIKYSYIEYWKNIYQKLTAVLWELHILYFLSVLNVYFSDFSNLSIVNISNFIMWEKNYAIFKKEN